MIWYATLYFIQFKITEDAIFRHLMCAKTFDLLLESKYWLKVATYLINVKQNDLELCLNPCIKIRGYSSHLTVMRHQRNSKVSQCSINGGKGPFHHPLSFCPTYGSLASGVDPCLDLLRASKQYFVVFSISNNTSTDGQ